MSASSVPPAPARLAVAQNTALTCADAPSRQTFGRA